VSERPILFNGDMVRAILSGAKVVTRRPIKPQPAGLFSLSDCPIALRGDRLYVRERHWIAEVAGQGVGEPFLVFDDEFVRGEFGNEPSPAKLRPWQGEFSRWGCRPSIHHPKWAARLWLKVTNVTAERLSAVTEADALAEGFERWSCCKHPGRHDDEDVEWVGASYVGTVPRFASCGYVANPRHRDAFLETWEAIYGKREGLSVDDDPWCWRVAFEVER